MKILWARGEIRTPEIRILQILPLDHSGTLAYFKLGTPPPTIKFYWLLRPWSSFPGTSGSYWDSPYIYLTHPSSPKVTKVL